MRGGGDGPVRRPTVPHRGMITLSIMLANIMQGVDNTILNVAAAAYPGQPVGLAGPDRLGADLLHRLRRDHDAADRLARRPVRHQARVPDLGDRLHRSPRRCAASRRASSQLVIFRALQGMAGAGLIPLSQATLLRINPPERHGHGDGGLRHRHDPRADHGAGARRLADRVLQLALGLLHQPAGRRAVHARHHGLHALDAATCTARRSTSSALSTLEPRDRRVAADARPRRAQGLVQLDRDLDRGDDRRARASICSSSTP